MIPCGIKENYRLDVMTCAAMADISVPNEQKSIKNTVARYDGTVNFSVDNGIFLVKMSFSLPEV